MPASSERQRRFMGAELARKRAGKKTKTGMSEGQLSDFASQIHTKGKRGGMTAKKQGEALKPHRRK